MPAPADPDPSQPGTTDELQQLLAGFSPAVQDLTMRTRAVVREVVPDATEEVDPPDKLLGYSFIPGTIKGLVTAITLQKTYVNLMFSKGVELLELDASGLLEGTGKRARHIKVRTPDVLDDPQVRVLLDAAARRTPRPDEAG
jgi:hypothetical protein